MRILQPEEVRELKFNTEHLTTREAGKKFGVSRTTVSNIRQGKAWAWIKEDKEARRDK